MVSWRPSAILVGSVLVVGGLLGAVQGCGGEEGDAPGLLDGGASSTLDSRAPGPVQTDANALATVGRAGGKVTTSRGVGVEIPAGALPNEVQVSVEASPTSTPPTGSTPVGTAYVLGPSGLKFQKPVTIVLTLDPAKLPPGKTTADIVVFTAPDGTLEYTPLPTKVRDATHVEAETTHFSVFVPAIPPPAIDDGGATDSGCGSCGTGVDAGLDSGTDDAGQATDSGGDDAGPATDAGGDDASGSEDAGGSDGGVDASADA